jgi:hypothetical protein
MIFALAFLGIAILLRLLPHPPNVAPIAALALFSGFYFRNNLRIVFPLAALFISDVVIGFYDIRLMAVVYASLVGASYFGKRLKGQLSAPSLVFASLQASILFYLTTNFAVWLFFSWYPHTFEGLVRSYFLALPFFRNTLLGDLFYSAVFFAAYEMFSLYRPRLSRVISFHPLAP